MGGTRVGKRPTIAEEEARLRRSTRQWLVHVEARRCREMPGLLERAGALLGALDAADLPVRPDWAALPTMKSGYVTRLFRGFLIAEDIDLDLAIWVHASARAGRWLGIFPEDSDGVPDVQATVGPVKDPCRSYRDTTAG